jgi:phosphopantothenoylcysteine decarboxylase/phosphopantothenate--cysteine ligase
MWQNPATQANVSLLRARGIHVMEPDSGRLTGSDSGPGRLPEAEAIVSTALALVEKRIFGVLSEKNILITAGGTREPIDAVRFIGNHSSGKQGIALAYAAKAAGAHVTLIGANIDGLDLNAGLSGIDTFISVTTASELQREVEQRLPDADYLIMAAAVSDFRVENPLASKIKRSEVGPALELRLIQNPDMLSEVCATVSRDSLKCKVVGFAAETAGNPERLATLAAVKLESKMCHALIANDVTGGKVFGQDLNSVYMIDTSGNHKLSSGTKLAVAIDAIEFIASL